MSNNFSIDIAKYAKKVDLELNEAVVAVCATATKNIMSDTPVDTGRLRANWVASINKDITTTSESDNWQSQLGENLSIAGGAYGANFILRNNLPYAYRIEYLGWSRIKSPNGMVRINMAKIARSLK